MAGHEKAVNTAFDWNDIKDFGIAPSYILRQNEPNCDARTIIRVQVSPPPTRLREISVKDVETTDYGIRFRMKYQDLLLPGWRTSNEMCIAAQTDRDEWAFVPLGKHLSGEEIAGLQEWASIKSGRLPEIGTEFEKHERQAHHFLYEILALWHALRGASASEKASLLNDTNTALNLHHNRILAEVLSAYRHNHCSVTLHPTRNGRCPDLLVNGVIADVKTIMTAGVDRQAMMDSFARKICKDIAGSERSNSQIGREGTYFVGAWSSIINSIFYTALGRGIIKSGGFEYKIHNAIPRISKGKMIFTIPAVEPFRNIYAEFDRGDAVAMVNFLAASWPGIDRVDAKKYIVRTNIRKGCEYGMSSDFPSIYFKVR